MRRLNAYICRKHKGLSLIDTDRNMTINNYIRYTFLILVWQFLNRDANLEINHYISKRKGLKWKKYKTIQFTYNA